MKKITKEENQTEVSKMKKIEKIMKYNMKMKND